MSDRPLPQTPPEDINPWAPPDTHNNTSSIEPDHSNSSSSIQPPALPPTALYYCRYLEDDDGPQFADDSMADYHVFGEQDLVNSNINLVDNALPLQNSNQPGYQSSSDDLGRDSPAATIAVSNGTDEGNDLLKSVSTRETRASRFRERLSLDDVDIPSSMFTNTENQGLISTSLGLQAAYFNIYGSPWNRRRRAKAAQDAEARGVRDRQQDVEKKSDKKERIKTGVEIYIFVVDIILLVLTIAVLAISIVMARAGAVEHDGVGQQQRWETNATPDLVKPLQEPAGNYNPKGSGVEEEWHRIPIGTSH
ncbi:hypothetical protein AA313_de0207020 [Arthrobotrys entomopaga]|nr:hypothetical protein AA313_de0207020 [Arthrobotrys entomopaga]